MRSPANSPSEMFAYDLSKFIPFRNRAACERVRRISKAEITKHPNPQFRIRVIEDLASFYFEFAVDIVTRLRRALEAGKKFVAILPVGPTPASGSARSRSTYRFPRMTGRR